MSMTNPSGERIWMLNGDCSHDAAVAIFAFGQGSLSDHSFRDVLYGDHIPRTRIIRVDRRRGQNDRYDRSVLSSEQRLDARALHTGERIVQGVADSFELLR